jgi:hypothetical protein
MPASTLSVNSPDRMSPPREALDVRGLAVLLDAIARHDTAYLIPCALATRAQVALHEHDDDLAHWLQRQVIEIGQRARVIERQMGTEPESPRVFEVLPLELEPALSPRMLRRVGL